jgi:YfiH family protein
MFHSTENLSLYTFTSIAHNGGPILAMSTRSGGTSTGRYHSLNLGFHVGDEEQSVLLNRQLLCRRLSIPLESLVVGQQVHGTDVAVVTGHDRGKGAVCGRDGLPHTDALVTDTRDVALMVLVADCAGILLYDPEKEVIGIAHGSWRGTAAGIGRKTVLTMAAAFGTNPHNIQAAISPSIGPCCYEVGDEVLTALKRSSPGHWEQFISRQETGSFHLNLWAAIRQQLVDSGVPEERIEIAGLCTSCRTDLFYSHRRENGRTGRNGIVITLQHRKKT